MATFVSNDIWVANYVRARIILQEDFIDTINNCNDASIYVQMWRTNTGYTTYGQGKLFIGVDGQGWTESQITVNQKITYNSYTQVGNTRSLKLYHNENGELSINVYAYTNTNNENITFSTQTFPVTLTKIDRDAPIISFTYSNVTSASFDFSISTNVETDRIQYSINNGSTWIDCGESGTIYGLTPNNTYSVKFRSRKTNNQLWGTSEVQYIKTLGASILNSALAIIADASTVNIVVNISVYDNSYYHKLHLKAGSQLVFSTSEINWDIGTEERTITLTTEQKTSLLAAMSNVQTLDATLQLLTYSDSSCLTQIGSISSCAVSILTSAENSAPTFTGFNYVDNNIYTVYLTGDSQYLIKDFSKLVISCDEATANNGSTISSYSAVIGNNSKESSTTSIPLGSVNSSGMLVCTVTVKDSRGYVATASKIIEVINYSAPKITSYTLRRENDIDNNIQLSFTGSLSKVIIDDINHNSVYSAKYRYKRTNSDVWEDYVSILSSMSQSGTTFNFNCTELISLDTNCSWDFHIQIQDQCREGSVFNEYIVIGPGTPHFSIRKKRIGINNKNPQGALDVVGDVFMNGAIVLGFVKRLDGESFDSIKTGGIYSYDPVFPSLNAPIVAAGFLEVLTDKSNVIQRYTAITSGCNVYIRSYIACESTWTEWILK